MLTVETDNALNELGLNIAAINLVDVHQVLVNREHQSFQRRCTDKLETDPTGIWVGLDDFIQSRGGGAARVQALRDLAFVSWSEVALSLVDAGQSSVIETSQREYS
jgi:hypothetical protein